MRGQQVYCWSFLLTWCGFSHNAVFSILSSHRAEVGPILDLFLVHKINF